MAIIRVGGSESPQLSQTWWLRLAGYLTSQHLMLERKFNKTDRTHTLESASCISAQSLFDRFTFQLAVDSVEAIGFAFTE